ncbi:MULTISPECIES: exodeoxyribonuclease VII small subunit [Caloramator]|uniref:Exodeoxyribonuclease 7 small subunit n=1 Tax=Caloramator proteoclasticus DSM 10124 TaxID=1121262 RepID=A0A1M4Y7C8_9CLOT|nr:MULTISPECIES: exodeoxyribonuclease VII small subunit [Caloramator]SHF01618.1 Exodeoxyribonuclease VII small subunit [Caloramator proteoclasticus DSM 10124]
MARVKKDGLTFEEAIKRLEEIVYEIEDKDLSLEDTIVKFKEGMELANLCNKKLDEAERKINVLLKGEKQELVEDNFTVEVENDAF